jgi:hypothetical protein
MLPILPLANIGKTVCTQREERLRERRVRMNGTVSSFYRVEPLK